MSNIHEIILEFEDDWNYYCTFDLKGDFILYTYDKYGSHNKIIWKYSTQTKNNKWKCKKFYGISNPNEVDVISISDKLFVYSNNSIYEWNILTEKSTRLIYNEDIKYEYDSVINIY